MRKKIVMTGTLPNGAEFMIRSNDATGRGDTLTGTASLTINGKRIKGLRGTIKGTNPAQRKPGPAVAPKRIKYMLAAHIAKAVGAVSIDEQVAEWFDVLPQDVAKARRHPSLTDLRVCVVVKDGSVIGAVALKPGPDGHFIGLRYDAKTGYPETEFSRWALNQTCTN